MNRSNVHRIATAFLAALWLFWAGCGGESSNDVSQATVTVTPADSQASIGEEVPFTATATYPDNTTRDITANVTWSSSDTAVATISNSGGTIGVAAAVGTGSTTITATWSDIESGGMARSGSTTLTVIASSNSRVVAIAAGDLQSFALKSDGTLWGWGANAGGNLGTGAVSVSEESPVETLFSNAASIDGGGEVTVVAKRDGTVWMTAWFDYLLGQGDNGGDDSGLPTPLPTPIQVTSVTGAVAVAAGYSHSLALKDDGTVWAWGDNLFDQLGLGASWQHQRSETPYQVRLNDVGLWLTDVTAIAAGSNHSLALKEDGTVWAWGNNIEGQLGINTPLGGGEDETRPNPVQVEGISGVTAICAGAAFSAALKDDGTVWTWGDNEFGQLGDGTAGLTGSIFSSVPLQVHGLNNDGYLTGIEAIACGGFHVAALRSDGTVWEWGDNTYSQMAHGTAATQNSPLQVSGLTDITAIAAGSYHSIALKAASSNPDVTTGEGPTVWTWGDNTSGQLGRLYTLDTGQVSGL